MKEKVILNTEQNGAAKIQEDTENLKQEFEKLMIDVQDLRQKLTSRAAQLEEIQKVGSSIIIKELYTFCLQLSCKFFIIKLYFCIAACFHCIIHWTKFSYQDKHILSFCFMTVYFSVVYSHIKTYGLGYPLLISLDIVAASLLGGCL